MTRRIFIDPRVADDPQLYDMIVAANPGAEIYPRRRPRVRMSKSVPPPARTELTPIGEQFVIPGCEKRADRQGSPPAQPSLWDKT